MNMEEDAVIGGVPLRVTLGPLTKDGRKGSFSARGDAATRLIEMLKTGQELNYESSTDDGQVRTRRVRVGRRIEDEREVDPTNRVIATFDELRALSC